MKTKSICILVATLAATQFALSQDKPALVVAQRITVERAGNDVAETMTTADVGSVKLRGTASYSNGAYRVASSGADIWGKADSFHLTSFVLDGDVQLVARVIAMDKTGPWAKAGVMLRDGAQPDARHALLAVTPAHGFTFQYRNGAKAKTVEAIPKPGSAAKPQDGGTGWIKLIRQGNRISGYSSTNGADWEWEGTAEFADLPAPLLAGLAVSSQDTNRVCNAMFDHVSVVPAPPPLAAEEPMVGKGDGLQARYFQNLDLTGKEFARVDETINFEWVKEPPVAGVDRQRFSARWEGEVQAQFTETYAFHLISDDRAKLWINGKLIIDDFVPHATEEGAMRLNLIAGQKYLIRVEYFQHGQAAVAKVLWSSPSTQKRIIPKTQLYSAVVDTDGDGMPDLWELDYGLNPKNPSDAAADPDGDGLTNLQEYRAGKNPLVADSYVSGLPAPWRGQDVGNPLVKGFSQSSKGTIAIASSGADIWGNFDNFHFVHQPLRGDGEIMARVVSLQDTDPWAKACVMFRAKLIEGSPQVMLAFTPEKGISLQFRSKTVGITTAESGGAATPPRWIKLVRRGNRFSGFRSDDGTHWEWVSSEQIDLGDEAFVGLAVSSHARGQLTTAVFDNISVNPLSPKDRPIPITGTGDGLGATYYDVLTHTNLTRIDPTVDFDWGSGSPHKSISPDYFSARWEGMVEAQFSETYAIQAMTDDGVRLWIDGKKVIDAWGDRAETKMTVKVPLLAAHKYLIKMEYYERVGKAVAKLHWSSPSTPKQAIPQTQLYSPLHADYNQIEDKDHDGMPDKWELFYGLDPTDPSDAAADPDKDELTNLQEYLAGTNPLKADTDGDGIPDGWEVKYGLNPNDPNDALLDNDHDGLTNLQEFKAGTNPNTEDTDGDGLSDAMEVLETGTNPLVNDIKEIVTVAELKGAETSGTLGKWTVDGAEIFAADRRGALEYAFKTDAANMYRIEIEGGSHSTNDVNKDFQLLVWLDGEYLGRHHLVCQESKDGVAHVFTPWIQPGAHTIRIFWDNASKKRSLKIAAVRLQTLTGADENKNGISDWVESRLKNLCGLEFQDKPVPSGVPIQSLVSPACLEGRGSYLTMMQCSEGAALKHGAGDRWYANIPLSIKGNTISVSFQNRGLIQTNQVIWQPTNLREVGDLMIRQGDALLLAMRADTGQKGLVSIDVPGLTNFTGDASAAFACRFEKAGKFVIIGTSVRAGQIESKVITVQVVAGGFNDQPAVWAGKSRLWTETSLPPEAVLDADLRLWAEQLSGDATNRLYGLALNIEEPHHLVARLGAGGPILAAAAAEGFRLYSGNDTRVTAIKTFEDASQLVEMTLVSTPVLPQVSFHVDLVVAGVIFEDGTISQVLTAKNFNELGEATVRFIRPASAKTSVCHKTRAYQGEAFLGIHR